MSAEASLLPLDEPDQAPATPPAERRSLYRAYRSLTFEEVAGQGHVTQTLRNAVRYGSVAHAYLFTGPRGTGKTSTARILARAVNCLAPRDGEPCNTCAVCLSMLERRALDLVEIDGASNNSVDDVRELRERVNFRPAEARLKVYIIDEVHMLSSGAFNALLKTLEEPPAHVLFLLATTEVQKVPATVASRCQILALRPIPAPEVVARLRYICGREGIVADDEVLRFIGAQSTGSLRDALSLLEQIRAYCGDRLSLAEVEAALGVARVAQVATLADAMAAGDLAGALLIVGELAEGGVDPRQLARQLGGYWREALLARAHKQPLAERHVATCDAEAITLVLRALLGMESISRRSDSPRWALELAIADATLALAARHGGTRAADPIAEHPAAAPLHAPATNRPNGTAVEAPREPAPPAAIVDAQPVLARLDGQAPDGEQADAHDVAVVSAAIPAPDPAPPPAPIPPAASGPIAVEQEAVAAQAEAVREWWPRLLRRLAEQRKTPILSIVQQLPVGEVRLQDGLVSIGVPRTHSFALPQLEKNRAALEEALASVLGGRVGVRYVTITALPPDQQEDTDYLEDINRTYNARA